MNKAKLINKLKTNLLFKKAAEELDTFPVSTENYMAYSEGDIIYKNDEKAEHIYCILYGLVKIKIRTKTGSKIITKAVGDFFGEKEILANSKRYSSAVADIDTDLYLIEKSQFVKLILSNIEIFTNVKNSLLRIFDFNNEALEQFLTEVEKNKEGNAKLNKPATTSIPAVQEEKPPIDTASDEAIEEEKPKKNRETRIHLPPPKPSKKGELKNKIDVKQYSILPAKPEEPAVPKHQTPIQDSLFPKEELFGGEVSGQKQKQSFDDEPESLHSKNDEKIKETPGVAENEESVFNEVEELNNATETGTPQINEDIIPVEQESIVFKDEETEVNLPDSAFTGAEENDVFEEFETPNIDIEEIEPPLESGAAPENKETAYEKEMAEFFNNYGHSQPTVEEIPEGNTDDFLPVENEINLPDEKEITVEIYEQSEESELQEPEIEEFEEPVETNEEPVNIISEEHSSEPFSIEIETLPEQQELALITGEEISEPVYNQELLEGEEITEELEIIKELEEPELESPEDTVVEDESITEDSINKSDHEKQETFTPDAILTGFTGTVPFFDNGTDLPEAAEEQNVLTEDELDELELVKEELFTPHITIAPKSIKIEPVDQEDEQLKPPFDFAVENENREGRDQTEWLNLETALSNLSGEDFFTKYKEITFEVKSPTVEFPGFEAVKLTEDKTISDKEFKEKSSQNLAELAKNLTEISSSLNLNQLSIRVETLTKELLECRYTVFFFKEREKLRSFTQEEKLFVTNQFEIAKKISEKLPPNNPVLKLYEKKIISSTFGLGDYDEELIPGSIICYPVKTVSGEMAGIIYSEGALNDSFNSIDESKLSLISNSATLAITKLHGLFEKHNEYKLSDLAIFTNFFNSEISITAQSIAIILESVAAGSIPLKYKPAIDVVKRRADGLSNFILAIEFFIGKTTTFTREPVLVSDILDDVLLKLSDYAKGKKVVLLKKYDADLVLNLNKELLSQAVTFLFQNSFDAMKNGGKIFLTTSFDDKNINIFIKDTGKGIPDNIKEEIFKPFKSFSEKGSLGIGLPAANKIIRAHGGILYLNGSNQGAEFVISLPLPF